jgi:hypothetical protein
MISWKSHLEPEHGYVVREARLEIGDPENRLDSAEYDRFGVMWPSRAHDHGLDSVRLTFALTGAAKQRASDAAASGATG